MKFLILNADYPEFIKWLYDGHPRLHEQPFETQMQVRMESLFGTADFYSSNLRKLGHDAQDVIVNLEPAQRRWAKERGIPLKKQMRWELVWRKGIVPCPLRRQSSDWIFDVLEAQIREFKPDILYCMALETVHSDFLKRVRPYYQMAIGQHAAVLPRNDISAYDLIVSSLPNQVEFFRRMGPKSELLRLGFEPRILGKMISGPKRFDVVFAGGLGGIHEEGTRILNSLSEKFNLAVWGYGARTLSEYPSLQKCYQGTIWGIEMYQALCNSRIIFNRHSVVAGRDFANNMRLYEATGVGSLLLTDDKSNLADIFLPGKEVIVYKNSEECVQLVDHYLRHTDEREAIARAGQERTLRKHTYYHRMQELLSIVKKYF